MAEAGGVADTLCEDSQAGGAAAGVGIVLAKTCLSSMGQGESICGSFLRVQSSSAGTGCRWVSVKECVT